MNVQAFLGNMTNAVDNYISALNQLRDVAAVADVANIATNVTDGDTAPYGFTAAQCNDLLTEVDAIAATPIPDILFHGRTRFNS